MNPETPRTPREEQEIRLVALMLGELSAPEAAILREQVARDPELQRWMEQLEQTIPLVREAMSPRAQQEANPTTPLRLSSARREALLQQFKTVTLPTALPTATPTRRRDWHWVFPMSAAAGLVALLALSGFGPGLSLAKVGLIDRLGDATEPAVAAAVESDYLSLASRVEAPRPAKPAEPASEPLLAKRYGLAVSPHDVNGARGSARSPVAALGGVATGSGGLPAKDRSSKDSDANNRFYYMRALAGGAEPEGKAVLEDGVNAHLAFQVQPPAVQFQPLATAEPGAGSIPAVQMVPPPPAPIVSAKAPPAGAVAINGSAADAELAPIPLKLPTQTFKGRPTDTVALVDAGGVVKSARERFGANRVQESSAAAARDQLAPALKELAKAESRAKTKSVEELSDLMARAESPAQATTGQTATSLGLERKETETLLGEQVEQRFMKSVSGLASTTQGAQVGDKVPVLGDLPQMGRLFEQAGMPVTRGMQAGGAFSGGGGGGGAGGAGGALAVGTPEAASRVISDVSDFDAPAAANTQWFDASRVEGRGEQAGRWDTPTPQVEGYFGNLKANADGLQQLYDGEAKPSDPVSSFATILATPAPSATPATATTAASRSSTLARGRTQTNSLAPAQQTWGLGYGLQPRNGRVAGGRAAEPASTAEGIALFADSKADSFGTRREAVNTPREEAETRKLAESERLSESARLAESRSLRRTPARPAAVPSLGQSTRGGVAIQGRGLAVTEAKKREESLKRLTTTLEKQAAAEIDVSKYAEAVTGKPATQEAAQTLSDDVALKRRAVAPVPQPEVNARENPFSTFSLNVSDVSFKLTEASLQSGALPDAATVRTEEFLNALDYRDPEPRDGQPIAFAWEQARYPFAHNRDVLRFSVKTAARGREAGRPLNLVLLLDNSGSMERADRVQIIRECLRVLAGQLAAQDKFSVVTFSRTAQLRIDGVSGAEARQAVEQVAGLIPEGGTNLEDALNLGYATARRHFQIGGVNRVVLLTDGAANLGNVDPDALKRMVEAQRQQGIALDSFGIGWEGLADDLLEVLTRNGDGRYGFINSPEEAAAGFAGQLAGALQVAASDVKVQVEFNPRRVNAYRQLGYAKHQLKKEQFRDNTVDAAEIGAAESGNALYVVEINPRGEGDLAVVRVRFKVPGTSDYREHEWAVPYRPGVAPLEHSTPSLRLASTAAAFAEWLVASPFAGDVTPDALLSILRGVPEKFGADTRPQRLESMIRQAKSVSGK